MTAGQGTQARYYAVEDRPVRVESMDPLDPAISALDLTSGAFVREDPLLERVRSGGRGVEELAEGAFERLVAELRRSASYARQITAISWQHTGDPEFPYRAHVGDTVYTLYSGDFPAEPMYSLLVGGEVVDSLDEWPHAWSREAEGLTTSE